MNIPMILYRATIFLCLVFLSSVLANVGMHWASKSLTYDGLLIPKHVCNLKVFKNVLFYATDVLSDISLESLIRRAV